MKKKQNNPSLQAPYTKGRLFRGIRAAVPAGRPPVCSVRRDARGI
jgi:hypothetical protein